jgi:DNA-binding response OmpR family regulator
MLIYTTDDQITHRVILKNALQMIFREKGFDDYEILECIHGADFLKRSNLRKPDLVFLDIHMPELDGLSTLVRYRMKDRTTPVIMASLETGESIGRLT